MIWDLKSYGDRVAVEEKDVSYTYSDLFNMCENIVSHMTKRSLVFVLAKNTIGSLLGYLAFLNYGIVPLMLDEKTDCEIINNLIHEYKPKYLWIPENLTAYFSNYKQIFSANMYCLMASGDHDYFSLHPDLALLVNTSGSIGSPKLVRQSYRNIRANAESIIDYLKIDQNEKAISSLPMNYVYGLSIINTHIMAGASIVLTELNCYTGSFWKLFNDKKATSFSGVPFMYEMLYKLKLTKKDLPSLRTMTQAGGKLSPEFQKIFASYAHENGKEFIIMYGASEATSRMGYLPDKDVINKPGSIGIAIPGGRFELIDENGNVINDSNITGELVYYGQNVMMGYAKNGYDLEKPDELHGKLKTGDMAYRDNDGYYYISGRKSRFIKILGKRFSLDETELLLKKRLNDSQIACTGKDDHLCVFVAEKDLEKPAADYLTNVISINHALFSIRKINEIPKNAAGKTLYSELEKLL